MHILVVLAYIELVIAVLAILSNSLFMFIIFKATSLHINCRGLLLLFSFSMYLITTSHGLTVFEFLYEQKTYNYVYFDSIRGFYWRTIHEFGYSMQSLSLLLFSIERLIASNCRKAYQSKKIKMLFVFLVLVSVVISLAFTLVIHIKNEFFITTAMMNVIDVSGCLILLGAWRRSIHRYRTTVGVFSLEQRFQLADVYTWSRHLIPAVLLASFSKFLTILIIWMVLTADVDEDDIALMLVVYNNILNLYTLVSPFVIILKHPKIREKMMGHRNPDASAPHAPTTLDGHVIPSKHDFFEYLKAEWQ